MGALIRGNTVLNIIITFKEDIDCETKIFLKSSAPKSVFWNIEVNFKPLRCCNILQKNQNSSIQWFFKTTKNSTPLLRKCFKTKFFAKKKISANFKLLGYSNFMQKKSEKFHAWSFDKSCKISIRMALFGPKASK